MRRCSINSLAPRRTRGRCCSGRSTDSPGSSTGRRALQDHRDPPLRVYSLRTLVAQRITAIALGYEDLIDHDDLRHDPLLVLLADRLEGRRRGCVALAGKSC